MWVTRGERIRDHPWNVTCVGPAEGATASDSPGRDGYRRGVGLWRCWDHWRRIKSPIFVVVGAFLAEISPWMVFIDSWFWLKPAGLQRLNKHVRRLFTRNRPFFIIWEDLSGYWDCSAEGLKPEGQAWASSVGSGGGRFSCSSLLFHHLWATSSKLLSRDFQRTINRKEISAHSCNEDDENDVVQVGGSHRLFRLPPSLLGLVCEEGHPSIVLSDFPVSPSQPFPSAIHLLRDEAGFPHHFTAHTCAPLWANQCIDGCVTQHFLIDPPCHRPEPR